MKIVIFNPKDNFTSEQQKQLSSFGEIIYTKTVDPDPLGGFEKAKEKLTEVMESLPNLKGVCLSTTSFGWVDLD